jgi:hypothetical protein
MNISLVMQISADVLSLHKFEMNVLQQFQTTDSTWPAKKSNKFAVSIAAKVITLAEMALFVQTSTPVLA